MRLYAEHVRDSDHKPFDNNRALTYHARSLKG